MLVHMDCAGCENKIRKSLQKLDGVDDVEIDMGMQKVTVVGCVEQKKVLKAARKTGRRAELWPFPYNPEYHNFAQQYYYDTNKTSSSAFSYNYYKHGYEGSEYGYYQRPPYSSIVDQQASSLFSDDNINACTIT
ncbi:hypothetical protein CRG98_008853 [Punica granatum]|uniref:HMA domain-containing protein n=1 Tax=Punica granatum TaxID=22663 RepID=A0A2I0KQM2_PUNGR|nr:hypothetical protein CRG98_008853 [Punica granatum]